MLSARLFALALMLVDGILAYQPEAALQHRDSMQPKAISVFEGVRREESCVPCSDGNECCASGLSCVRYDNAPGCCPDGEYCGQDGSLRKRDVDDDSDDSLDDDTDDSDISDDDFDSTDDDSDTTDDGSDFTDSDDADSDGSDATDDGSDSVDDGSDTSSSVFLTITSSTSTPSATANSLITSGGMKMKIDSVLVVLSAIGVLYFSG
ncbi:hypothetical protein C8J56DRAFT_1060628 [Mycena floridula]|nr:hypothetical protein C8J56DRAFT_1060628 [Mycena floridula]